MLVSFAWFYIVFPTGQVPLSALSWCSACTSVSEGVFLMYPWRKIYSMSSYSSAILFSQMSAQLLIGFFVCFLLLSCMCYLYILEIKPSLVISFANIFSPFVGFLFIFLFMFPFILYCAEAYKFDLVPFVYFYFYFFCLGRLT